MLAKKKVSADKPSFLKYFKTQKDEDIAFKGALAGLDMDDPANHPSDDSDEEAPHHASLSQQNANTNNQPPQSTPTPFPTPKPTPDAVQKGVNDAIGGIGKSFNF